MADPPTNRMSEAGAGRARPTRLDASGPRDVVFCHGCSNEWYQDEGGLVCPSCDSEATEIVTADNDIRPAIPDDHAGLYQVPFPDDMSDPDEEDIEEFLHSARNANRHPNHPEDLHSDFFSETFRTTGPTAGPEETHTRLFSDTFRTNGPPAGAQNVIRQFHETLSQIMGPTILQGQYGRSGPEALFNDSNPNPSPFGRATQSPIFGGAIVGGGQGHHVVGQRFTFVSGRAPVAGGRPDPQNPPDDLATYATPVSSRPTPRGQAVIIISITAPPDQLRSLLNNLFGAMGPLGHPEGPNAQRGGPPGLPGIFANLFNPANAVAGDVAYTQEALDRIVSQLMEQHATSNAPGPAPADAIASLPKKAIDEEMLGPEFKAECSVCMDDVFLGDEVVVLPCKHWFHEACAAAWLGEHNTCPICRTGIGNGNESPGNNARVSPGPSAPPTPAEHPTPRSGWQRADAPPEPWIRTRSRATMETRRENQARLDSIRRNRHSSTSENPREGATATRRYQAVGDGSAIQPNRTRSPSPPHLSNPSFRRRDSQADMSEPQRESRRASGRHASTSEESRRSSNSGGSGGSGGGALGWLRRFGYGSGASGSASDTRRGD